jgi:hypothetical protein
LLLLLPQRTSTTFTNTESVAVQRVSSVNVTLYHPLMESHTWMEPAVLPLLQTNEAGSAPSLIAVIVVQDSGS